MNAGLHLRSFLWLCLGERDSIWLLTFHCGKLEQNKMNETEENGRQKSPRTLRTSDNNHECIISSGVLSGACNNGRPENNDPEHTERASVSTRDRSSRPS